MYRIRGIVLGVQDQGNSSVYSLDCAQPPPEHLRSSQDCEVSRLSTDLERDFGFPLIGDFEDARPLFRAIEVGHLADKP